MLSRKGKKKANYNNGMFWKQSQYDEDNYRLINFSTNFILARDDINCSNRIFKLI